MKEQNAVLLLTAIKMELEKVSVRGESDLRSMLGVMETLEKVKEDLKRETQNEQGE